VNAFLSSFLHPEAVTLFKLISARLAGIFFAAPLWSMTALPHKVRAALTVVVAGLLVPTCAAPHLGTEPFALILPLAMETLVGTAIGVTAAAVVHGAALAGEVLSIQMGVSLGPALAPMPDAPVAGLSQLASYFAVFVFVGLGGHLMVLEGVARSLTLLPPGSGFTVGSDPRLFIAAAQALFTCALSVAAPVLVTLLIANVALALLNRAVPQFTAMTAAFPITIGLGLVALGFAAPLWGHIVADRLAHTPAAISTTLRGFTPATGAR